MITEIYIDPKRGCDWYTGEKPTSDCGNGALKTIGRAIQKIDNLRKTGERCPITVWLMPGEYYIDKTITIPKGCCNIEFRPLNNDGKVTILGAKKLENLCEDELFGVKCLSAKLTDGMIPEDLFANDKRAETTRYPDSGYLTPTETGSKTEQFYDGTDWMIADRDLSMFDGIYDATIVFRHYWVEERLKIESFDPKTFKTVFTKATTFSAYTQNSEEKSESTGRNGDVAQHELSDANSRMDYIIEGLPQMLKKPNQWVYKKDLNKIYYIPESFETENALYAPCVTKMFDVYADNIYFKDIVFKYTSSHFECETESKAPSVKDGKKTANFSQAFVGADGVMNFYGSHNSVVERCKFKEYGLYGINIDNECSDIDISKCVFENSSGGGIKICHNTENPELCVAHNINVSDCLIKNIGLVHTSAIGILITLAENCRIRHNEICYTGYSGISVGWEWGYKGERTKNILIEKNHIHHISQGQLSDVGGIYMLGVQRGTRVIGNVIHDVQDKTYGGIGIYADEGASLITFENNICYNVSENGFQLHFGYENIVRNNMFESGRLGVIWDWFNDMRTGMVLKHNILISKDDDYFFGGRGTDVVSSTMESDSNIFWNFDKQQPIIGRVFDKEKTLKDWQNEFDKDINSVVNDPMFVDYENKNFNLKEGSPAYKIGFIDIDTSNVGIRK